MFSIENKRSIRWKTEWSKTHCYFFYSFVQETPILFCSQGREQDRLPHNEPWLPWQGKYGGAQGLVLHVRPDQILDGKRELGRSCSIQAPGWTWGTWPRANDLHTLRYLCLNLCTFGSLRTILELPEPRIWKNILYDWVETDHCSETISSRRRPVSLLFSLNMYLLNYSYLVVRWSACRHFTCGDTEGKCK